MAKNPGPLSKKNGSSLLSVFEMSCRLYNFRSDTK